MTKEKNQPTIKSADDLIVKTEQERLGKIMPDTMPVPDPQSEPEQPQTEAELDSKGEESEPSEDIKKETEAKESEPEEEPQSESDEEKGSSEASGDDEVDEYGTKVGKKKLYTEEEVQRMIRDRLKRGQHAEQSPQQQQAVQQAAKDFVPDPDSSESWESQLETFVENTVQKMGQKKADAEWRKQEEQTQAEFEVKFSQGMTKYKDFNAVVGNKPISNAMMLATRTMKDPAAFLYAACKQQPKELARIAGITDPVAQATEIGRLEERMKKAKALPSAPKPASKISGDASSEMPQLSIEARIAAHAKSKIMR